MGIADRILRAGRLERDHRYQQAVQQSRQPVYTPSQGNLHTAQSASERDHVGYTQQVKAHPLGAPDADTRRTAAWHKTAAGVTGAALGVSAATQSSDAEAGRLFRFAPVPTNVNEMLRLQMRGSRAASPPPALVKSAGSTRAATGISKYMTEEEASRAYHWKSAESLVGHASDLPGSREVMNMSLAGEAKRGWYRRSAQALVDVFGNDAPRFTALLAALSPQTSVQANFKNAMNVWEAWKKATHNGGPMDPEDLKEIINRNVQGGDVPRDDGEKGSALDAWIPNAIRVLKADPADIHTLGLSGPKVDSFYRNLMGHVDEVTNDTWQARGMGVDQSIFGGAGKENTVDPYSQTFGVKGPGYLATNVRTRQAADRLSNERGNLWVPAEVQETSWSAAKTLSDLSGELGISPHEVLDRGLLLDSMVADTTDFGGLLSSPEYAAQVKRQGYPLPNLSAQGMIDPTSSAARDLMARSPAARDDLHRFAGRLDPKRSSDAATRQGLQQSIAAYKAAGGKELGFTDPRLLGGVAAGATGIAALMASQNADAGMVEKVLGKDLTERLAAHLQGFPRGAAGNSVNEQDFADRYRDSGDLHRDILRVADSYPLGSPESNLAYAQARNLGHQNAQVSRALWGQKDEVRNFKGDESPDIIGHTPNKTALPQPPEGVDPTGNFDPWDSRLPAIGAGVGIGGLMMTQSPDADAALLPPELLEQVRAAQAMIPKGAARMEMAHSRATHSALYDAAQAVSAHSELFSHNSEEYLRADALASSLFDQAAQVGQARRVRTQTDGSYPRDANPLVSPSPAYEGQDMAQIVEPRTYPKPPEGIDPTGNFDPWDSRLPAVNTAAGIAGYMMSPNAPQASAFSRTSYGSTGVPSGDSIWSGYADKVARADRALAPIFGSDANLPDTMDATRVAGAGLLGSSAGGLAGIADLPSGPYAAGGTTERVSARATNALLDATGGPPRPATQEALGAVGGLFDPFSRAADLTVESLRGALAQVPGGERFAAPLAAAAGTGLSLGGALIGPGEVKAAARAATAAARDAVGASGRRLLPRAAGTGAAVAAGAASGDAGASGGRLLPQVGNTTSGDAEEAQANEAEPDTDADDQSPLMANFHRNRVYAKPGNYFTKLDPNTEVQFRRWVAQNNVPFNPDAPVTDYDMRGFYQGLLTGDPQAVRSTQNGHFDDKWKTPYHESFSSASQWAAPGAPTWNDQSQLVTPDGRVVFDEPAVYAQRRQQQVQGNVMERAMQRSLMGLQ